MTSSIAKSGAECWYSFRQSVGDNARQTGKPLEPYRANLAALVAERQPEVDALSRKLARQDAAIAGPVARLDL
jgi:hypothetical protein